MNSSAYTPIYAQNEATAVDGSLLTTDLTLSSSLLADDKPAPGSVAAVPGQSLLSVTAPANLPEGYEFPVVLGQQQFMVQVPPGGVEVGQQFTVPMPCKNPQYRETATTTTTSTTLSIPVGHFRDGECDLFQYGACHLHCWTSCFCPLRE